MPTYEYRCTACGHEFEAFQSMTEAPVRTCPACGKDKVQRLISAGAGFIFKGSGFYITDYRSEDYKRKAKKDTESATPNAKSGSDSKPSSPAKSDSSSSSKSSGCSDSSD